MGPQSPRETPCGLKEEASVSSWEKVSGQRSIHLAHSGGGGVILEAPELEDGQQGLSYVEDRGAGAEAERRAAGSGSNTARRDGT